MSTSAADDPDRRPRTTLVRVPELGGMDVLHGIDTRPDFPRHLHATFAIGVIERGAVINRSHGRRERLGPGSVYAFDPGDVHDGTSVDGARVDQSVFYPGERGLDELAAEAGLQGPGRFRARVVHAPRTGARLTALRRLLTGPVALRLEREAALEDVLVRLLVEFRAARRTDASPAAAEPRAVRQAREYLDEHLTDDVSIAQLAAAVNLSPGYLSRAFRHALGLPPHAWLIQRRIERAKALIDEGRALCDVALAVGFADQSHLNRHFRRTVGVTPGRYAAGRFRPRQG